MKHSERRFLIRTLPAATLGFLLLAALLWLLPELRLAAAERALAAGDHARALGWLGEVDTAQERAFYDRCRFEEAVSLEAAGRYAKAREIYSALDETPERAERLNACDYALAEAAYTEGRVEDSLAAFTALGGYRDSRDRAETCRMALAERAYEAGLSAQAVQQYLAIGSDAAEARAAEIAMAITGLFSAEEALLAVQGVDGSELARWEALRTKRESLKRNALAVGFLHTLGLRADGTAVAVGDDTYGQCGVSEWKELTAVAAGAYHSVGLRRDGTVVAAGDDRFDQCKVGQWRNVVAIAANDYGTAALTEDGAILTTGYLDYAAKTADWPQDLVQLTGGGHIFAAVRENGSALATHPSSRAETFFNLVGFICHSGYAVGLFNDGTVCAQGITLPDTWQETVALSGSATRVAAIRMDGSVAVHTFQRRDEIPFALPAPAVAAAVGGTHMAFLLEDGRVCAFGENGAGQCGTEKWSLFSAE